MRPAASRQPWRLGAPPASKLRCDEGICYFGVYLQWKSVRRGEQGGQRAGVRLAKEGGVEGRRGDCV